MIKDEQLRNLVNNYERWSNEREKRRWRTDVLTFISENYELPKCPRCGENIDIGLRVHELSDGVPIFISVFCPECRKIEYSDLIGAYYGDGVLFSEVVRRFNEKFAGVYENGKTDV